MYINSLLHVCLTLYCSLVVARKNLFVKKKLKCDSIRILDAILFPERMSHIIIHRIPLIWTETLNAMWRWNTYYNKKLKFTNTWYHSTLPSPQGSACVCGKHSTANIVERLSSSLTCGTGLITKIWLCSNLSTPHILHLYGGNDIIYVGVLSNEGSLIGPKHRKSLSQFRPFPIVITVGVD